MVNKCPICGSPSSDICSNCKGKSERASIELKKLNIVLANIKLALNSSSLLSSCETTKILLRKSYSQCQEEIKKYKKQIITEEQITPAQKWWNTIIQNVKNAN